MAVFTQQPDEGIPVMSSKFQSLCEEDACLLKNYRDAAAQIYHHGNMIIS